MRLCQRHSGFTLVELLIGMFIAVALYAVVLGPTKEYVQRQKLQKCTENLRRLHLVLSLYANEHEGAFPAPPGAASSDAALSALVPKYSTDHSLFVCPATGHSGERRFDYAYVMGLRKDSGALLLASDSQVSAEPKLRGMKVFADAQGASGGNHGKAGGNLLFADGHAETIGTAAGRDLVLAPGTQLLNPSK
jgi:prepilin-type processing-associated H-X9-DG protein/prepilin-type N-terminal cleavage/methylation domain-containing protein